MNSNSTFNKLNNTQLINIAKRITYLRTTILHMTQRDFAASISIGQAYLSLIETGKKFVSKSVIDNILLNYNVNITWLLQGLGTDNDIFLTDASIKESFDTSMNNLISQLVINYHLSDQDEKFLKKYFSLTPAERIKFINSISSISELFN